MNAVELIKTRRSIREFTNEPISHDVMDEIISVAAYAPSWKNTQITRYVVVEGALKDEIAKSCFSTWQGNANITEKAAALVVVTFIKNRSGFERDGSYSTNKEDRWQNFDAGIATQTFALAAHDKGLGTVIMGIFDEEPVAKLINLPEDRAIAALVAIGHPAVSPEAPKRKEVSDLVSYLS